MKDLEKLLRSMPPLEPPEDLTPRVMASLPNRLGLVDRLGYALRGSTGAGFARNILLPSTPAELGLLFLSVGLLIFTLVPAVLIGLYKAGLPLGFSAPVMSLFPALTGAVLLALAGWVQIKSPGTIVPQQLRLGIAALLFGMTVILGWGSGVHQVMNMIAAWLGVSGLIVTAGLALAPRLLFSQREVYYA